MRILYQGFQTEKELGHVNYIWRYLLLLLMKYQWFRIYIYFIYVEGCEKYLATQKGNPFGDLSIIVVGNLLQLLPIKSPQIFEKYNSTFYGFFNLWSLFLMAQVTEVMGQKGDKLS